MAPIAADGHLRLHRQVHPDSNEQNMDSNQHKQKQYGVLQQQSKWKTSIFQKSNKSQSNKDAMTKIKSNQLNQPSKYQSVAQITSQSTNSSSRSASSKINNSVVSQLIQNSFSSKSGSKERVSGPQPSPANTQRTCSPMQSGNSSNREDSQNSKKSFIDKLKRLSNQSQTQGQQNSGGNSGRNSGRKSKSKLQVNQKIQNAEDDSNFEQLVVEPLNASGKPIMPPRRILALQRLKFNNPGGPAVAPTYHVCVDNFLPSELINLNKMKSVPNRPITKPSPPLKPVEHPQPASEQVKHAQPATTFQPTENRNDFIGTHPAQVHNTISAPLQSNPPAPKQLQSTVQRPLPQRPGGACVHRPGKHAEPRQPQRPCSGDDEVGGHSTSDSEQVYEIDGVGFDDTETVTGSSDTLCSTNSNYGTQGLGVSADCTAEMVHVERKYAQNELGDDVAKSLGYHAGKQARVVDNINAGAGSLKPQPSSQQRASTSTVPNTLKGPVRCQGNGYSPAESRQEHGRVSAGVGARDTTSKPRVVSGEATRDRMKQHGTNVAKAIKVQSSQSEGNLAGSQSSCSKQNEPSAAIQQAGQAGSGTGSARANNPAHPMAANTTKPRAHTPPRPNPGGIQDTSQSKPRTTPPQAKQQATQFDQQDQTAQEAAASTNQQQKPHHAPIPSASAPTAPTAAHQANVQAQQVQSVADGSTPGDQARAGSGGGVQKESAGSRGFEREGRGHGVAGVVEGHMGAGAGLGTRGQAEQGYRAQVPHKPQVLQPNKAKEREKFADERVQYSTSSSVTGTSGSDVSPMCTGPTAVDMLRRSGQRVAKQQHSAKGSGVDMGHHQHFGCEQTSEKPPARLSRLVLGTKGRQMRGGDGDGHYMDSSEDIQTSGGTIQSSAPDQRLRRAHSTSTMSHTMSPPPPNQKPRQPVPRQHPTQAAVPRSPTHTSASPPSPHIPAHAIRTRNSPTRHPPTHNNNSLRAHSGQLGSLASGPLPQKHSSPPLPPRPRTPGSVREGNPWPLGREWEGRAASRDERVPEGHQDRDPGAVQQRDMVNAQRARSGAHHREVALHGGQQDAMGGQVVRGQGGWHDGYGAHGWVDEQRVILERRRWPMARAGDVANEQNVMRMVAHQSMHHYQHMDEGMRACMQRSSLGPYPMGGEWGGQGDVRQMNLPFGHDLWLESGKAAAGLGRGQEGFDEHVLGRHGHHYHVAMAQHAQHAQHRLMMEQRLHEQQHLLGPPYHEQTAHDIPARHHHRHHHHHQLEAHAAHAAHAAVDVNGMQGGYAPQQQHPQQHPSQQQNQMQQHQVQQYQVQQHAVQAQQGVHGQMILTAPTQHAPHAVQAIQVSQQHVQTRTVHAHGAAQVLHQPPVHHEQHQLIAHTTHHDALPQPVQPMHVQPAAAPAIVPASQPVMQMQWQQSVVINPTQPPLQPIQQIQPTISIPTVVTARNFIPPTKEQAAANATNTVIIQEPQEEASGGLEHDVTSASPSALVTVGHAVEAVSTVDHVHDARDEAGSAVGCGAPLHDTMDSCVDDDDTDTSKSHFGGFVTGLLQQVTTPKPSLAVRPGLPSARGVCGSSARGARGTPPLARHSDDDDDGDVDLTAGTRTSVRAGERKGPAVRAVQYRSDAEGCTEPAPQRPSPSPIDTQDTDDVDRHQLNGVMDILSSSESVTAVGKLSSGDDVDKWLDSARLNELAHSQTCADSTQVTMTNICTDAASVLSRATPNAMPDQSAKSAGSTSGGSASRADESDDFWLMPPCFSDNNWSVRDALVRDHDRLIAAIDQSGWQSEALDLCAKGQGQVAAEAGLVYDSQASQLNA